MAIDLEKVCSDIRQLQALRDEHKTTIFVELALQILSVAPETDLTEVRRVMKERHGFSKAKDKFYDPAIRRARENGIVFEQNEDTDGVRPSPRSFCCPLLKGKQVPKCCCRDLPGTSSPGVCAPVDDGGAKEANCQVYEGHKSELCLKYGVSQKAAEYSATQRYDKLSNVVRDLLDDLKKKDKNKGVAIQHFSNETIPTRQTVTDWMGKGTCRYRHPDIRSITAFWIETKAYENPKRSNRLFNAAGICLSPQFDFDLVVKYFIENKLSPDDTLRMTDFNKILEEIGVPKQYHLLRKEDN